MIKLKNIKNILFDCDGVLYQDLEAVFGQVSKKMTEYISKKLNLNLKVVKINATGVHAGLSIKHVFFSLKGGRMKCLLACLKGGKVRPKRYRIALNIRRELTFKATHRYVGLPP